jgi:hypothetical protein
MGPDQMLKPYSNISRKQFQKLQPPISIIQNLNKTDPNTPTPNKVLHAPNPPITSMNKLILKFQHKQTLIDDRFNRPKPKSNRSNRSMTE